MSVFIRNLKNVIDFWLLFFIYIKKSCKRIMMNWLLKCCFIGENLEIIFSEVEFDFRNRVGSIVRKLMGSVSSLGSYEIFKGSMSKFKGNYM